MKTERGREGRREERNNMNQDQVPFTVRNLAVFIVSELITEMIFTVDFSNNIQEKN